MQWIPILLVLCNSLAAPFRGLEAVWYQDGIKIRAEYDNFGGVDIDRILTVPGFSSIGFLGQLDLGNSMEPDGQSTFKSDSVRNFRQINLLYAINVQKILAQFSWKKASDVRTCF